MIRSPLSTTTVLDEMTDVVARAASPWAALLAATSLPYRFLQVLFFERVAELGPNAIHYGRALGTIANWSIAAFVLSRWGRAVWSRACRLPSRDAWRVPATALLSYLYVASIAELVYYASTITIVGPVLANAFAGLACGTMELNTRPSALEPVRNIARYSTRLRRLIALQFVFLVAVIVALANLYAAFGAGLWLAHAFGGAELVRWDVLLSGSNKHFFMLLIAGAIVAVEPFWIAAHVVLVRKAGVAESGDDLRTWFHQLQESWR